MDELSEEDTDDFIEIKGSLIIRRRRAKSMSDRLTNYDIAMYNRRTGKLVAGRASQK